MDADHLARLTAAIAQNPPIQRVMAPTYYATGAQGSWTMNDVSLSFLQGNPGIIQNGEFAGVTVGVNETISIVHMSAQTAKDIYLIIGDGLKALEEQFGEIETDFSRSRKSSGVE